MSCDISAMTFVCLGSRAVGLGFLILGGGLEDEGVKQLHWGRMLVEHDTFTRNKFSEKSLGHNSP